MAITYHVGDATDPPIEGRYAVAHVLSTTGAYGAGFAAAVAKRYPTAKARYLDWHAGKEPIPMQLGRIQWVGVGRDLPGHHAWWDRWIVNLVAQRGLRSATNPHPLDLDALHESLHRLSIASTEPIAMPRIGCGLAGGTWEEVEPIIDATIGHLEVHVYDLPSR